MKKKMRNRLLAALSAVFLSAIFGLGITTVNAGAKTAEKGTARDLTITYSDASAENSTVFMPSEAGKTVCNGTFDEENERYYTTAYRGDGIAVENNYDGLYIGGAAVDYSDFIITMKADLLVLNSWSHCRLWFRVWDNRDWLGNYVEFVRTDDKLIDTIKFCSYSKNEDGNGGFNKTTTTLASVSGGEIYSGKGETTIRLAVKGTCASLYLNGENVLNTANLDKTHYGHFEWEFWNCSAALGFPIEIGTDVTEDDLTYDALNTETSIVNSAPVVSIVESASAWASVVADVPSAAICYLNDEGKLAKEDGTAIGDRGAGLVFDTLNKAGILTGFYVKSEKAADMALEALTDGREYYNAFVVSSLETVIKYAKNKNSAVTCIWDATGESVKEENYGAFAGRMNACGARIIILSQRSASKTAIDRLQSLLVGVWVRADSPNDREDLCHCILSGANGIIGDVGAINDIYKTFDVTTLVRTPDIVAHRGDPDAVAQNTLEGAKSAYEKGASAVEADIFLTKDGEIVVSHDAALGDKAEGSGNIEDLTAAEVLSKRVYITGTKEASEYTVPTLKSFFEYFADKDLVLYVELKQSTYTTYGTESNYVSVLKEKLRTLIAEYGMENKIVFITFFKTIGADFRKDAYFSRFTLAMLYSTSAGVASSGDIAAVTDAVNSLNAALDIEFSSLVGNKNLRYQMLRRGILSNGWTYTSLQNEYLLNDFLAGVDGLTTDNPGYISKFLKTLTTDSDSYDCGGETKAIALAALSYDGTPLDLAGLGYTVLTGNAVMERSTNGYTIKECSENACVLFYYEFSANANTVYRVYTQPISLTAAQKPDTSDRRDQGCKKGCGSSFSMAGISLSAVLTTVGIALILKGKGRKKND